MEDGEGQGKGGERWLLWALGLPSHATFPGEVPTFCLGEQGCILKVKFKGYVLCAQIFLEESKEVLLLTWACLFVQVPQFLSPVCISPSLSTTKFFSQHRGFFVCISLAWFPVSARVGFYIQR